MRHLPVRKRTSCPFHRERAIASILLPNTPSLLPSLPLSCAESSTGSLGSADTAKEIQSAFFLSPVSWDTTKLDGRPTSTRSARSDSGVGNSGGTKRCRALSESLTATRCAKLSVKSGEAISVGGSTKLCSCMGAGRSHTVIQSNFLVRGRGAKDRGASLAIRCSTRTATTFTSPSSLCSRGLSIRSSGSNRSNPLPLPQNGKGVGARTPASGYPG